MDGTGEGGMVGVKSVRGAVMWSSDLADENRIEGRHVGRFAGATRSRTLGSNCSGSRGWARECEEPEWFPVVSRVVSGRCSHWVKKVEVERTGIIQEL